MKSQVNAILHTLLGLIEDVRAAYPALRGLDRDSKRLSLVTQTRGLGFLSLDLPILGDLLLAGLRDGRLPLDSQPFGWVSKRCMVPRFLSGLWLRVFESNACLKVDADINAVAFLLQFATLAKKVRAPCSRQRTNSALKGYYDVETSLKAPTLNWEGDKLDPEGRLKDLHLVEVVEVDLPLLGERLECRPRVNSLMSKAQQIADLILSRMSWYDPFTWSDQSIQEHGVSSFRHGRGAVAVKGTGNDKSEFQSWPRKLEAVFPFESFGKMSSDSRVVPDLEHPSLLHFVPKTLKGPRIIAAEPVEHMWCQQSILNYLEHEFKRLFAGSFIDLRRQDKSADLVLKASLDRSLATVDLSEASDRLSCFVVERMFRRNPPLLIALHAARTRFVKINHHDETDYLKFKKFASQGTGTTFPVQSLVFLIAALAVSLKGSVTWDNIKRLRKTVRVYGDDIIVPTHGYEDLRLLLTHLGLKVNDRKSFADGYFRESCGTEAYRGYVITPIKPKVFDPSGPGDTIALIDGVNNLFKKGYWHASNNLSSFIPNYALRRLRFVGPGTAGPFGLTSFSGYSDNHLNRRWNDSLQRIEVSVFAKYEDTRKRPRDGYSRLVDLSTMRHSPWNPRTVSETGETRYAKGGVRWEPSYAAN